MSRPVAVELPADSVVAHLHNGADLADAMALTLRPGATRDIGVLADAVLGRPSPGFRTRARRRERVFGTFGTLPAVPRGAAPSVGSPAEGAPQRIGLYPVVARGFREVVVGADTRHLDYRASVLLRTRLDGMGDELVATTIVNGRTVLGRAWIALIGPLHRVALRRRLARAGRELSRTGRTP